MGVHPSFWYFNSVSLACRVVVGIKAWALYVWFSKSLSGIGSNVEVDAVIQRIYRKINDFGVFSAISHFE